MSIEEYNQLLKNLGRKPLDKPKKNKYNSRKVWVDGIRFDSQKEADYYCQLKLLQRAGEIEGFSMQARFIVTAGSAEKRATEYVADFIIFYPDKTYRIVDVKGMETPAFKLKMKSFKEKYPKLNLEVEK